MNIQRLTASGVPNIGMLDALPNVVVGDKPRVGINTIVTTADKLIESPSAPHADILMIDEAYQLKYSSFMMIRELAPRSLTIGDPGQIDPIVQVSVRHWADNKEGPHLPAPQVILARNEARHFQLPLSWRLPSDSADIIRSAFYPNMNFTGLVTPGMRNLNLRIAGITQVDCILDTALRYGSMAAVTLPSRVTAPADLELITLLVEFVNRVLSRDPVVIEGSIVTKLQPSDIGIVVSRREQVTAVGQALGTLANQILVETANRFQGLERKVIFGIHPLSGVPCLNNFNLNPGRMCVTMSRHQVMCILLTRAGLGNALAGYIPNDDRFLGQVDDPSFVGWRAHQSLWKRLEDEHRVIDV